MKTTIVVVPCMLLGLCIIALYVAAVAPDAPNAHAAPASPAEQLRSGVAPDQVRCGEGKVLVIRPGDRPACVSPSTADRLGLEPVVRAVPDRPQKVVMQEDGRTPDDAANNINNAEDGRVPRHFVTFFRGEPIDVTVMVSPDRTGYWRDGTTKAELDELVSKFAEHLTGHSIVRDTVTVRTPEVRSYVPAEYEEPDEDSGAKAYNFRHGTGSGWFISDNTYGGNFIDHQGWDEGSVRVIRHDYVGFLSEFMDAMGFEGWGFYCPHDECKHQFGHDHFVYTLINGKTSDERRSHAEILDEHGPHMGTIESYLSHLNMARGRVSSEYSDEHMETKQRLADTYPTAEEIINNYPKYKEHMREYLEPRTTQYKAEYNGTGRIDFKFDSGSTVMRFNGWSDYPVPDPVLNRTEAIKRALEFARTDEFMLDRCVIDVPDRSEEDRPRYIYLTQVASTPFWNVDGISCNSGHGVLIYVDALDGKTVWFKGDGQSTSSKKARQ